MIRRLRKPVVRAVRRVLAGVTARHPRLGFRMTDLFIMMRASGPREKRIRAEFPSMTAKEGRRVARRMVQIELRNRVVGDILRWFDVHRLYPLVHFDADLATLHAPAIIGTFHLGAEIALWSIVERLPAPVFAMRRYRPARVQTRAAFIEVPPESDERRAMAFHLAFQRLRAGEIGMMMLDPGRGPKIGVPFMGHTLWLARGPFALARLSGASIVPVVGRWRGTNVETVIGSPLAGDPQDVERSLAAAAARWLEQYLDEYPEEISPRILELMTSA